MHTWFAGTSQICKRLCAHLSSEERELFENPRCSRCINNSDLVMIDYVIERTFGQSILSLEEREKMDKHIEACPSCAVYIKFHSVMATITPS